MRADADRAPDTPAPPRRVLVDGRVFSTGAHDRGMGRYLAHIIDLLKEQGADVTVLLFRNCHLGADHPLLSGCGVRFADYDPDQIDLSEGRRRLDLQHYTSYLQQLIELGRFDVYVDGTPFLGPPRLDVLACAVITICYDFIPLRHADHYLSNEEGVSYYHNGLTRVWKADHVICISETVRAETAAYLAVPDERLSVIAPRVDASYSASETSLNPPAARPYLFSILGSHKSKNPEGAMRLFADVLRSGRLAVRMNVPTEHQYEVLKAQGLPPGLRSTFNISDEEKQRLLEGAAVVAHMSLEEGFGIPLLEAIFSGKKIVALDIPMNREILGMSNVSWQGAVHLLAPDAPQLDGGALDRLLAARPGLAFYESVRDAYVQHWESSGAVLSQAVERAVESRRAWLDNVEFKMSSSIPGENCGIADYSVSYVRSAAGNVVFFFGLGDEKHVSYLPNVKTAPAADYDLVSEAVGDRPGLFNFGLSPALYPGLDRLRKSGRSRDRLLVHEREYADAWRHLLRADRQLDDFMLDAARQDDRSATRAALALAASAPFNARPGEEGRSAFPSDWLTRLGMPLVHHLPPAVLAQMREMVQADPDSVLNELADIEDRMRYAPMGIDDRSSPATGRAAARVRRLHGLQPEDLLVGHFGLILPGIKQLDRVAAGVAEAAERFEAGESGGRRIFLSLVGRILDADLFASMNGAFAARGLAGRVLHSNPELESDFEAEMAACDVVVCLRSQRRGHYSHALVRSLSLGRPTLVNRASGFSYDPETTIEDADIAEGVAAVVLRAADPVRLAAMRRAARNAYTQTHRGRDSLREIIGAAAS